jgi:hypothetical protein
VYQKSTHCPGQSFDSEQRRTPTDWITASDGQVGVDGDELLVQDRVIVCFGSVNWDAVLQRLELKAQFVIPSVGHKRKP